MYSFLHSYMLVYTILKDSYLFLMTIMIRYSFGVCNYYGTFQSPAELMQNERT